MGPAPSTIFMSRQPSARMPVTCRTVQGAHSPLGRWYGRGTNVDSAGWSQQATCGSRTAGEHYDAGAWAAGSSGASRGALRGS